MATEHILNGNTNSLIFSQAIKGPLSLEGRPFIGFM